MNQESEEYPLWRVLLAFLLFLVVMGVSFYFFRSTGVRIITSANANTKSHKRPVIFSWSMSSPHLRDCLPFNGKKDIRHRDK